MTALQQILMSAVGGGIKFVGGATAVKDGATTGNSTIPLNSGLTGGISDSAQSGDFVIAVFATADTVDRTLVITDGTTNYTQIADLYANSTVDPNLRIAYKFITADTATTFGPTQTTIAKGTMAVYVFRNVNVTTPLDVTATTATLTNSRIANPPSITPITPGAFIVAVGAGTTGTNGGSYSSSDLINFFTAVPLGLSGAGPLGSILGIGHKADWISGAFDPAAFTLNGLTDATAVGMCAATIALRPA